VSNSNATVFITSIAKAEFQLHAEAEARVSESNGAIQSDENKLHIVHKKKLHTKFVSIISMHKHRIIGNY
jgi:hypothetical protein